MGGCVDAVLARWTDEGERGCPANVCHLPCLGLAHCDCRCASSAHCSAQCEWDWRCSCRLGWWWLLGRVGAAPFSRWQTLERSPSVADGSSLRRQHTSSHRRSLPSPAVDAAVAATIGDHPTVRARSRARRLPSPLFANALHCSSPTSALIFSANDASQRACGGSQ